MATRTKKASSNAKRTSGNKQSLKIRLRRYIGADKANDQIDAFRNLIDANNDKRVKKIPTATAFYVKDVMELIEANPGCKKLRVYHAFRKIGGYHTFMVAEDGKNANATEPMVTKSSSTGSRVLVSCCHCKPCRISPSDNSPHNE